MRKKITLVGGGQIGGNLALLTMQKELGDILIFDIPKAEGMVKGKALDLMQLRPHDGFDSDIRGTSSWDETRDTDVFIITAGIPRKPGMNREDLLDINLSIIRDVANNIKEKAPNAFVIVISNPLDAMVYAFHKISGFPKNQVVGMAGALDSTRFRTFIAMETGYSVQDVSCMVLGGHGDTMVPISRLATVGGVPVTDLIKPDRLKEIEDRTRFAGGEIVKLFMITSSGAEGINLKNTRYVHITEPYWHPVRVEQVIGRARRICSHEDLPDDMQDVKVFLYLMQFTDKQVELGAKSLRLDRSKYNKNNTRPLTTDEALLEIMNLMMH